MKIASQFILWGKLFRRVRGIKLTPERHFTKLDALYDPLPVESVT